MKPSLRGATQLAPAYAAARLAARLARVTLVLALILAAVLPSSAGDRRTPPGIGQVFGWGTMIYVNSNVPVAVNSLGNAVAVAGGDYHRLILLPDGTVWSWGFNESGQLGDGSTTNRYAPVQVLGGGGVGHLAGVIALAGGGDSSLALKGDGTVWAWGANSEGQLGDGSTTQRTTPVQVVGVGGVGYLSGAVAIAVGSSHSLALLGDGTVVAWGSNDWGQLGRDGLSSATPLPVNGLSDVKIIVGGVLRSVALKSDGTVWTWGYNGQGQLGDGSTVSYRSMPGPVSGLSGVAAIASGNSTHILALKSDGTVWAWGANQHGQLGDGTLTDRNTPVQVSNTDGTGRLSDVRLIACGGNHTLALTTDGTLLAWGYGTQGQRGDGTTTMDGPLPVPVISSSLSHVVAIAGAGNGSLAIQSQAVVGAWGWNRYGQIGNGAGDGLNDLKSIVPVQAGELTGVAAIGQGWRHSLAVTSDGHVWGWGSNEYAELGADPTVMPYTTPVQVQSESLSGVVAVAGAASTSYALKSDGTLWAWGDNHDGLLGIGQPESAVRYSLTPVQVIGLSDVVAVAGGLIHALALKSDGTVWSWGFSQSGQVGDGSYSIRTAPVQVMCPGIEAGTLTPLVNVVAIAAGSYHSVALTSSGAVWVWGNNLDGQLGLDPAAFSNANRALQVSLVPPMVAVAGGGAHTLALTSGGRVWAWGDNSRGQLGVDWLTIPSRYVPAELDSPDLTTVVALAGSDVDSFALRSDGTVWGWGYNTYGNLGNGTTTRSYLPTRVAGMSAGVAAITSNWFHSLALALPPVAPPLLTVVADDRPLLYGDALPTLTYHIVGPDGSDWQSPLLKAPTCVSDASSVGTHPITCSGAEDLGYQIAYRDATLTVNPAPLTITAKPGTKTYGMTLVWIIDPPSYPGTYITVDGLRNADTVTNITLTTDGAPASAPAGTYAVTPSLAAGTGLTNYNITYASSTLIVNKALLTVKANDLTVGSGSVTPTLTATVTGFVNGETPAVLTGEPSLDHSGGVITVNVSGLSAANYTFVGMNGVLRVTEDALQLFNNYFVTGDFVTGSAALRGTGSAGKATGTITIPDSEIPAMAEIVAAYLYWQTVEDPATAPAAQGTFREQDVHAEQLGGDLPYSDSGAPPYLGVMRFYRASVLGFLPLGIDGRRVATGGHLITLPDSGSAGVPPVTPGATLVVIYRVMSNTEPLRAVVIYDGAFAAPTGEMYQRVRAFFDADTSQPAKLAQIWTHGGTWQGLLASVSPSTPGLSLNSTELILSYEGAIGPRAASAVVFSTPVTDTDNDGLLDAWEAAGYYRDAHDNSPVGLPGAGTGQKDLFVQIDYMCSQVTDSACAGHSHLPKLDALAMVAKAFLDQGIRVHFDVGNNYQGNPFIVPAADARGGNPIQEETCHDDYTVTPPRLCPFPEQPGVLAWKTNLGILKTWPKDLDACANSGAPDCTPRFQHGRKDSYHYVVFAHALGLPRWSFQDGGITGIAIAGTTATITTSGPHEVFPGAHITISGAVTQPGLNRTYLVSTVQDDHTFTVQTENVTGSVDSGSDSALFITVGELPTWSFNYRLHSIEGGVVLLTNPHALNPGDHVTIAGASTSGLNGTWPVTGVGTYTDPNGKTYYTFAIPVAVSADANIDKDLSIISAQGGTVSGYADVGGADVAIALGKWLADGDSATAEAGTLMHELGHNLGLTHGGYYFDGPAGARPTFETNCKPNYQSVMNYLFQIDLLRNGDGVPVVGYSGQQLNVLNENLLEAVKFLGSSDPGGAGFVFPEFANTSWYTSTAPAGNPTAATRHCDGRPLLSTEPPMYRIKGDAGAISPAWANSQDINFDGSPTDSMRGYSDWDHLDLRQVGATGSEFYGAGFWAPGGGFWAPGGGFWAPGGGFYAPGGGFYAPGGGLWAPGGGFYAPGGGFYAPGGGFWAPGGGFWAPGGGFYAPGGGFYAPGGGFYAPGGGFYAPGGGFYAPGGGFWAPGGGFYAPGGGFWAPGGGTALGGELTYETADSVVREPESVTVVTEGTMVVVRWAAPIFGHVQTYYVYRMVSDTTTPVNCAEGNPLPANTYACTDTSPAAGATYFVSTVLLDGRESAPVRAVVPAAPRAQSVWLSPLPDRVFSTVPFAVTAVASSGLAVDITGSGDCTVQSTDANHASVTMKNVGTCTITASQAGDDAFGLAAVSGSFAVVALFTMDGFFAPVSMTPSVYNTVKAGSTVPLKFKVFDSPGGTVRSDTGVVKAFQVFPASCSSGTLEDPVDFVIAGGTSLRYDSTLGGFVQNWQTPSKKGCYQVAVTLLDGTSLKAAFKTK